MKKVYKTNSEFYEIRRLKRADKALTRKRNARSRNRGTVLPISQPEASTDAIEIQAPVKLDIYSEKYREHTIRFVRKIRNCALRKKHKIRLLFDHTDYVTSAAMLLLLAMVDRVQESSPKQRLIYCSYPKIKKTEQVLQQIGFLNKLDKRSRIADRDLHEDVDFWRASDGTLFQGEKLDQFISAVLESGDEYPKRFYSGLKEAIVNCVEHAYIDENGCIQHAPENKWWIFGGIKDNEVVFSVCDLGLGIPRTLPIKNQESEIQKILDDLAKPFRKDTTYIEVATHIGMTTRPREDGRGHGLSELRKYAASSSDSLLRIYSNKGVVQFGKDGVQYHDTLKESIMGTIIEWSSPIGSTG